MRKLPLTILVALFSCIPSFACSVPVFRYALERWDADTFPLIIFNRGPLDQSQSAIFQKLTMASEDRKLHANFVVKFVDLSDNPDQEFVELFETKKNAQLPLMFLAFPESDGVAGPAWTGPLTAENARLLIDSPARREIAKRLGTGESAVWVLLSSEDKTEDDRIAGLLSAELKHLETTLKLPKIEEEDMELDIENPRPHANLPLKIWFSTFRVSHLDPAEKIFVSMLQNCDRDSVNASGPRVYPIFGRGRALCGLPKKYVENKQLTDPAAFLIGSCSCEVKRLNPGVDLLIAQDWDAVLENRIVKDPEIPSFAALIEKPDNPPLSGNQWKELEREVHRSVYGDLRRQLLPPLLIALVVAILATCWIAVRFSRKKGK